jgi:hypothetical protein
MLCDEFRTPQELKSILGGLDERLAGCKVPPGVAGEILHDMEKEHVEKRI